MQTNRTWLILITFALYLAGCVIMMERYPRPPMYSNAQDLSIDRSKLAERVVTFQTQDDPTTVQSFFEDRLLRQGWTFGRLMEANRRSYRYETADNIFAFTIFTDVTPSKLTNVKIQFTYVGPGLAFPSDYQFPPRYN